MSTKSLISLSSAELRALVAQGDAAAQAEIDRRAAKRESSGKWTVAALRAHGRTAEADARVAAAKASKAVAKVVAAAPAKVAEVVKASAPKAPAVAFTRTNEVIAKPKSAVAHLHNRMCEVEKAVLSIASTQASMKEALDILVARTLA